MARYSISENILTRMGDALRVHFGDYKTEGTTEFKSETPLVFNTPNFIGFEGNDPIDPIYWVRSESKISFYAHTFIFHGAASIKVAISYSTGYHGSGDVPRYEYIWIAEGLHKRYDMYEPGHYLKYCFDEKNKDGWYQCSVCGSKNVYYELTGALSCGDCGSTDGTYGDGNKSVVWVTPDYTYEEYEFQGDTITVYPEFYDDSYGNGFYMEIRAYDADGNELKMYDLTTGKIPNSYSPEEMITAIEKLNYFPNGEEVKF